LMVCKKLHFGHALRNNVTFLIQMETQMAGQKGRSGGHNKKSMAEHKLDGTYRAVRHAGIEQEGAMKVKPEQYITNDYTTDKAELFERFSDLLFNEGLTSGEVDSLYISQIVDLYDAYVQAAAVYGRDGIEAKVGSKLAINLMIELQKEMRIMLGEYSLTPSTRAKTDRTKDTDPYEVADPIADFLNTKPRLVK